MHHYNSWPLGALPDNFRRPEPYELLQKGYTWKDPRDIVTLFEEKLASYAGSKYAVTTDSCSNALFLALRFRSVSGSVLIPRQTYASVPMQIIHAGGKPVFEDLEWTGIYQLGNSGILDSAGRFTHAMYEGDGALQCLSFQIKKRLPIGRGGCILTDDKKAYEWLKLATYDGRDLNSPYDSRGHISQLGWHFYMTPEDAARGILLMDMLPQDNPDTMSWNNYPPLTDFEFFRNLS